MIRVGHFIPFMGVGGMEQMMLQLCRYRDRERFSYKVATDRDDVLAPEIRNTGVSVFTGAGAYGTVADWADVIVLHWAGYRHAWHTLVSSRRKPYLTALQWPSVLPDLPAITICSSEYAYRIQRHRDRCIVIPNGVDLAPFGPRGVCRENRVTLVRICRPPKCAPYFWDAMHRVLRQFPETRLQIVGNPDGCRDGGEQVKFLGIRRDVPEILARSDIFVYTPSPGHGTKDLVVMEACAAGVPCVVSDVNATNESVKDGVNGFLCPFGNVDSFVERVGILVKDSDLRHRMGQAAAQIARQEFDIRDTARRYEMVYRTVLRSHYRRR